jgi:hypothetical protein
MSWPLNTLLIGMVAGNGLKGEAEAIWQQQKDAGYEILNKDVPDNNEIENVLLMYLQVRYILYMVLGKPVSR